MEKCKRCGTDVQPGQKICDNCGLRLAAPKTDDGASDLRLAGGSGGQAPQTSAPASAPPVSQAPQAPAAPAAPPPVPHAPQTPAVRSAPSGPRQHKTLQPSARSSLSLAGGGKPQTQAPPPVEESGEKTLCPECMQSFDAAQMTEFQGRLYCPNCIAKISKEKDKPRGQAAVEVAGGGPVEQKSPVLLKLLVILGFVALVAGVAFGVYYIITQKPVLPPPVKIVDDGGLADDSAPPPVSPAAKAKEYPAIEVPVSKGHRVFRCPVCLQECPFVGLQEQPCIECGRRLVPVIVNLPDVKYVAKDGDAAVLQHGDKELRAKIGEEIMLGSGIKVEKFTELGLILEKTETVTFQDHREGQQGEKTRDVTVRKEIPKFREGGLIRLEVMRGTRTLTCDGKWKNRVYHKDPVIMPMKYMEPGTYTVPCANPDCWNVFEVRMKDFPEIRIPITKLSDKVNCLQCGAERYLVPRGRPEVFQCTGCDRQIALYLWTLKDVSFLRQEGDQAVIRHNGKQLQVKVGQELTPGSDIKLEEIGRGEEGEFVRVSTSVDVEYEEFEDGKGVKKSKVVSLQDRIYKARE